MGRRCFSNPNNGLMAAASALAAAIAEGKTAEELNVLSALFTVLGDNLALLALCAPSQEDCQAAENCENGRCR